MTAISTTTPVDVVTPAARPATYVLSKGEKRFIGLQLLIATAALSIGSRASADCRR